MSNHLLHRRTALLPTVVMAILAHLVPLAALAEDRVALVIGNADYPSAPLRNPVNDARAMSRALREVGFEVFSLENANKQRMEQAIVRFADRLEKDTSGLFYYAGHGVQANGHNYLIPVDAKIGSARELRFETVGVNLVLAEMGYAGNRINIVILDACRNNPFERRLRGASRGLAAIDAARGTIIAYATAPGSVALDGDGANGIYTEELLGALREPGLQVEEVFKRVRVGVARRTKQQQIPWESSSLIGNFVFKATATSSTAQGGTGRQAEFLFWQSVSAGANPDAYRAYLRQFPQGTFADLAHIRLEELQVAGASAVLPGITVTGTSSAVPVPDIGETAAHGTFLAKAEPALQASAPAPSESGARERILIIGVIAPRGTVWGNCGEIIDGDAIAEEASKRLRAASGFDFLISLSRSAETRSLWRKSGLRSNPIEEKIRAYGMSAGVDGVLVFTYEVGGSYCNRVEVEAYLYDVSREASYHQQGNHTDISRMTDELVAEFSAGRATAQ